MSTYERFEDTPVWQAAADLAAAIFDWVEHPLFRGKGDLAAQLQRAALSISNNIAEGFERGTTAELVQFLYYAPQMAYFRVVCQSIWRPIRGRANSLENSDGAGRRQLASSG